MTTHHRPTFSCLIGTQSRKRNFLIKEASFYSITMAQWRNCCEACTLSTAGRRLDLQTILEYQEGIGENRPTKKPFWKMQRKD